MAWEFGIPDFLGPYTYLKSLNTSSVGELAQRKRNLYRQAQNELNINLAALQNVEKLKSANDFITNVAASERGKEIAAIRAYCKDTQQEFPKLEPYLADPETIYNDPYNFYLALTTAINEIRMDTNDYLQELKRIKRNILNKDSRTIYDYQEDDYRYKLVKDIDSFLHRLSGNYSIRNDLNEFSLKVQNIAMNVLEKSGMINEIASGEDFAAIAASVLVEIEGEVQKEFDNSKSELQLTKLEEISDDMLNKIEQRYLKQLYSRKTQSPVQKALMNINGVDFLRITQNAKQLLNIDTKIIEEDKLESYLQNINVHDQRNTNKILQSIRSRITSNKSLSNNLSLINFSIAGSTSTKQGTINELVQSLIGTNVRGNVGTDIITYRIKWDAQKNTKDFDQLITQIGEEFSSVLESEAMSTPSNMRDLRQTIVSMNEKVDQLIEAAEKKLKESKNLKNRDLFIFHETLKLYSSVETGNSAHAGFGGRTMNIISYIDFLNSAASIGVQNNISRDILAFFARNLIPGAIAENAKDPLEKYFSIYAGMIMFDDVTNMAREAVSQINNSNNIIGGKIRQVHLYNLNGIYVPASMILSFISDAMNKAAGTVAEDFIQATIQITGSGRSSNTIQSFYSNLDDSPKLTEEDWNIAASAAINSTKVKIIFLAAFQNLIESLSAFSK